MASLSVGENKSDVVVVNRALTAGDRGSATSRGVALKRPTCRLCRPPTELGGGRGLLGHSLLNGAERERARGLRRSQPPLSGLHQRGGRRRGDERREQGRPVDLLAAAFGQRGDRRRSGDSLEDAELSEVGLEPPTPRACARRPRRLRSPARPRRRAHTRRRRRRPRGMIVLAGVNRTSVAAAAKRSRIGRRAFAKISICSSSATLGSSSSARVAVSRSIAPNAGYPAYGQGGWCERHH